MFKINFFTFIKDYDGFGFSVFSVGIAGERERCLFAIAKDEDAWYFDIFFLRII